MNAKCIKHPDNPCYDKSYAEENTLFEQSAQGMEGGKGRQHQNDYRGRGKRKTFEMITRDLYEAHLHLEENDIQISTVAPYVGKENASAASALLYNIVGRGQSFNNLRKFTQEIFKYLKLK